ncbi:type II and III secretion system protein family protein [Sphingosinicella rhizophila]|uniref:Type II and III secretion system protein family protein n=1 Tax=Sphingosinicella rhizophila TaxID=3050082 RepID=A0ABU3Q591_9SPHN|nr:type II and III secretion system protein family protein [Sphingosinicella sp. GR2756]MDT9598457.1 type II and III secretion system protein family protein [Sphingosinicella sp. GR2756]
MTKMNTISRFSLGTAIAAFVATGMAGTVPAPALAQSQAVKPTNTVPISAGTGRLVRLERPITDLFVANSDIADVQVKSANQIYIFGKGTGETSVFATDRAGRTVYSATVRVGPNIASIEELLQVAMPEARLQALPMNNTVLLTGTVAAPVDVEEAARIVQAYVGEGVQVISRIKTATPLQVMLKVKIAEVNRTLSRNINTSIQTLDQTGGFNFGLFTGRDAGNILPGGGGTITPGEGTTIGGLGRLFGLDVLGALDLAEQNNLVTTLAEPTLTAVSGETASFLAGGEFPIPIAQGLNATTVEFKQYGVSLSFTPIVLEGGRISMRVRPEVSEISSNGAVILDGTRIPALTTRRTETTVELGSGQSFMISGLLSNSGNNSTAKTPFLGNLPILGALFKSNSFQRNETELVVVVTPYLVKPVNAGDIALPTDGFAFPTTAQRMLIDRDEVGRNNAPRPEPTMAGPQAAAPGVGPSAALSAPTARQQAARREQQAPANPGFSF